MTRKSIDRLSKDLGRKRIRPTPAQMLAYKQDRQAAKAKAEAHEANRDVMRDQDGGSLVHVDDRGEVASAGIAEELSGDVRALPYDHLNVDLSSDGTGPWGYRHDIYCSWCGSLQSCSWTWREIIEVLKGASPMLLTSKGTCGHKMSFACNVGQPEVLLAVQKGWVMVEENGERVDLSNELLAALVVHEKAP
jgi:hypothetical protein